MLPHLARTAVLLSGKTRSIQGLEGSWPTEVRAWGRKPLPGSPPTAGRVHEETLIF